MISEELKAEVLKRIDAEEVAELALKFGNTYSPAGHEQPMAEAVYEWLRENGFEAELQQLLTDRSNVIGYVRGKGGGRSLIFNSHMDTEIADEDDLPWVANTDINKTGGVRRGNRLYGHTVLNDRGPMAAFLIAAKAIKDAGVELAGDIILTSVVGEIGMAPVDEWQGLNYQGKGFGTQGLINKGIRADFALVAETTNFALSWVECGALYLSVSIPGRAMYTPRSERGETFLDHPNAIVRAAKVVEAIEQWGRKYEVERTRTVEAGRIVPKVTVGAIRGGLPYRPNRTAPLCKIYVDIRIPPGDDPLQIERELTEVIHSVEPRATVSPYLWRAGHIAEGVEPLADAYRQAYRSLFREDPPAPSVHVTSMWRDINVFNGAGIPALTVGPTRHIDEETGQKYFEVEDLGTITKLYALTAMDICAG